MPSSRAAVPEHVPGTVRPHAAHPGCFATAMLLAIVPLVPLVLRARVLRQAVTGSRPAPGARRSETTHHP
jgi:N-acetyl-gamma-glutamylphosphate reductase